VQGKVREGSITLHPGSTLVVDGADIIIEGPLEVGGGWALSCGCGGRACARTCVRACMLCKSKHGTCANHWISGCQCLADE